MFYRPSAVGCNIVITPDTQDAYTEEVYYKQLEVYRSEGFTHVEFSHVFQLDAEAAHRLRIRAAELGIVIWSVHAWHLNEWTPEAYAVYCEQQKHHAVIAAALGARIMICHLPNVENRFGDFDRSLKVIGMMADLCRENGICLAVETCNAGDPEHIIKVVDTLDRPEVGINVDVGHVNAFMRRSPGEVIRLCGKRINTLHLHDNYTLNDDHQMPGAGTIDWEDTVRALKEVGYSGPLMMEMNASEVKARRTAEIMRDYETRKERIQGAAYLDWMWQTVAVKLK